MGSSTNGVRVKNAADMLQDFADAATTFAPVVISIRKTFLENLPQPVGKEWFIQS